MNKGSNLTVIVVAYNRLEYTKRTLNSLYRTVPEAHIVVMDNNSQDGTYQYLFDEFENKKFPNLMTSENFGWGCAVNNVLSATILNPYILISNNDVEYKDGWYDECLALYEKYPQIGILGVWKHPSHGIRQDLGDLLVKDDVPAVGWLMKPEVIKDIGAFPEHGPCATKGGNGEDSAYVKRAQAKGYWVACPKEDVGLHIDGI